MKKFALLFIITTQSMSMQKLLTARQTFAKRVEQKRQAVRVEIQRKIADWKEKRNPTECPYTSKEEQRNPTECPYTSKEELGKAFFDGEIDGEMYRIFFNKIANEDDN